MKKSIQRAACAVLAIWMVLAFPACKKKEGDFKPTFQTQPFDTDTPKKIHFLIPKKWGQVADPSGAGLLVFAGASIYEEGGGNNVSVCIYETESPAPALEDVEAAFKESFEAKVKEQYPEASNFAYGSFQTPLRTVFTAEYEAPVLGKELKQKVYYPLADYMQIYVAACDNGADDLSADEVAHEIVQSLRLEGEEVPEEE